MSRRHGEGNLFPFSLSPKKAKDKILRDVGKSSFHGAPKAVGGEGGPIRIRKVAAGSRRGQRRGKQRWKLIFCAGEARDRYLPRKVKKKVNDVVPSPLQLQDDDTNELISRERGSAFREQVTVWTQGALYIFLSC